MLGPIDQPQFAFCDRNNRPVGCGPADGLQRAQAPCRFAPSTSMNRPLLLRRTASRAAQIATGCCCCSAGACVKTYGWMFIATGSTSSHTHRRADALSMARCASAEKMPVVPAISSSVFEGSKALQPLRPSAVAQRRHALGLASLVCGMAVTRERRVRNSGWAVCEAVFAKAPE